MLLAVAASAFAQTTEVVDTLFMNDAAGTRRVGHIVGIDAKSFQLDVPLTVGPAGASARVAVPRAQVSRIEFAPNEARDRLIANPTAASTSALNIQWLRWQAFLAVPKSPAGAIANAYAAALLATNDPKNAATALDVFSRVEREGWSEADHQTAKQGRLRAMIATGHAADAVNEAKSLAKESEDPTVLIEAKFILAEAALSSLNKLVDENPRWTEDVLVRPEHDRLYNEALDLYLHPYLFLGSETDAAARGLWGAVQVYRFGGDDAEAVESARDLTQLYAGTKYAKLATDYLARLPEELKKQDAEKDAREDKE
jgi:hypothetical protein